jgi:CheY-like chemotaxis protein
MSPHSDGARPRILIVGDPLTNRRNLRDALGDRYDLCWAGTACDTLAAAFAGRPRLILLDINIDPPPAVSTDARGRLQPAREVRGIDVCRQLTRSVLKQTPIIVLSAETRFLTRIRGRLAHAADYLSKPVDDQLLRERICRCLDGIYPGADTACSANRRGQDGAGSGTRPGR